MQKLKAGALQLTLFICVVIALLLGAFIILIHTHKRFNGMSNMIIETVRNADNGVAYALSNNLTLNDSINIKLESDLDQSIKVYKSYWGLFEKITSKSTFKSQRFSKIALLGGIQSKTDRTALYVHENNKPLVLVGNTRIQGSAYLSKRGVKSGNISGKSYYGQRLIYGQEKISTKFPRLSSEVIQSLNKLQKEFGNIASTQVLDISKNRNQSNSFLKPVKYVLSSSDIVLSNASLAGHIIIISRTKIVLDASTNLKDVVLVAPRIEIKNNTSGTFQAIASKEILVGENCDLKYPSALVVNEMISPINPIETHRKTIDIVIGNGSNINGIVMYLGRNKGSNTQTQLIIEEKATVKGEVYCNQNMELKGAINGSVFVKNFMVNQFGSIYQNHIYNGTINIYDLPQEYVGLSFNQNEKGVLKWLY